MKSLKAVTTHLLKPRYFEAEIRSDNFRGRSMSSAGLRIRGWRGILALIAVLVGMSVIAQAQLTSADVVGTVTDSTGAVLPGAKVTIKNLGTQVSAIKITNGTGDYVFNLLSPGHYSLRIEGQRFKEYVVSDITLAAGDRVREDAKMETGSIQETINVTAAAPLLQTDSSSVSSVVTEQEVQDLPLNGRNFINLVQIQPGVNGGAPNAISSGSRPDDRRETSTVSANGQSDFFNNQMIDGMDNNEREQGFLGVRPSIDAIAEVKVDTNAYSAEISRDAGAVVNIITKSGTNVYHGSAYEFFRNDIFDARDFFATTGIVSKPEYRQNQFGGSIGGPIIKNKTFFFGDLEDNRNIQGIGYGEFTVPTLYEEQNPGDFSDIGGPVVPTAQLDSVGLAYFKMYPKPNIPGAGAVNNFTSAPNKTQYALSSDGRVDQHFGNGDLLYGRYSYNNVKTTVPGPFPAVNVDGLNILPGGSIGAFAGPSITKAHGVQLGYVHPFTQNLVLELKTGYTRIAIQSLPLNEGVDVSTKIGVINGNTPAAPATSGLTPLNFQSGGYANVGDSIYTPILDMNNTFQYMGSVTYTHRAHNIKVGAQLTRRQLNYFQSAVPLGWIFINANTALGQYSNAMENLLTGIPNGWMRMNSLVKPGYRAWEEGFYAQDDWRVTHSLTVNLGVRYDIYTPFTEAHNLYSNFDYSTLTLITGDKDPHIGIKTDYKNIGPRVGFSQSIGNSTVVRGGYGISYYPSAVQGQILSSNPPYQYNASCIPCSNFTWPVLPIPTPSSTTNLSGSLVDVASNFNTSSAQMFNLMVQRQFKENVVTVGYLGELGRRLIFQPYINIPNPTGPYPNDATNGPQAAPALLTATTLPNVGQIQIDSSEGTSNYHSMQAVFARRFTHGLSLNANYTWAHCLSDAITNSAGGTATGLLATDVHYDYGNCFTDVRHRFVTNFNYDLPFGKEAKGASALLLKGWKSNFILYWQTGIPFTVGDSFSNANGLAQINLPTVGTDRPNVTGTRAKLSNPSIHQWFNLAAFTPQAAGTAGNEHNEQYYGPGARRADFSLFKTVELPARFSVQFRAECYNISNTPNFSGPASTISGWTEGPEHGASNPISVVGLLPGDIATSAGGVGQVTSTAANINPRQFQFALKLLF